MLQGTACHSEGAYLANFKGCSGCGGGRGVGLAVTGRTRVEDDDEDSEEIGFNHILPESFAVAVDFCVLFIPAPLARARRLSLTPPSQF